LFVASQYAPAAFPTQLEAVPHLQTPAKQVSPTFPQASTAAAHLHPLLAASQYSPVSIPTHVVLVPQLQIPSVQVSPMLHVTPAQRSIITFEEAFT
jgi:hypothetical protein